MTQPEQSREPVLHAARLGGLVAAVVVAVAGLVSLIAAGRWADLGALGASLGGLFTALAALGAYLAPVWQARKAREKVTPLSDPRDDAGRPLVPEQSAQPEPPRETFAGWDDTPGEHSEERRPPTPG